MWLELYVNKNFRVDAKLSKLVVSSENTYCEICIFTLIFIIQTRLNVLEYGVFMKKKYALAIAASLFAAESVLAAPSGDKTVVACGFDDMFGNSCYWRCPDMEDTYRTEKKDGRCANVLFRCANYPRSFMRSSVGSSEIWITPDKYNHYFGKLPQEYDCSISEEEMAMGGSRQSQPVTPQSNPYASSKYQNTSTYDEAKNLLIDNRDGERYSTVKIGGRVWMAENLKFRLPESYCYDNVTQNCDTYGRLYSWNAARRACPDGWSLPMGDDLNYQDFSLNKFRVLDGGYYVDGDRFIDLGNRAFFWLGDEKGGDRADAMSFRGSNLETFAFQGRKANGYSVRCIQNWDAVCKDRLGGVMDDAGRTYRTLKVGNQTWMAEDVILDRLDEMEARSLGRACPRGWHVPEQSEYEELFSRASDFELRANDKRMKNNRDTKENPCSLNFDFKRGYWTASKNGNEMTYVDWKYNAVREKASPFFKHGDAYTNKLRCVKNAPSYASPKPQVRNDYPPQQQPASNAKPAANKTVLEKFILQGVTFGVGQSRFTKESSDGLKRLADHLRNYHGKTIEIVSHTDNIDRPERSRVLALKRAEEVKNYLSMSGIPSQDIVATGKGGDEPLVPNTNAANRMKNNRIEVFVYTYDAPAAAPNPASKQNGTQQYVPTPKKPCKERDLANTKLGECYSYTEGTKDHRRCMAAYKNLLNIANSKCK